jgi:hypothetical protein
MKQREYTRVCNNLSEVSAFLSAKLYGEGNKLLSNKFMRLAFKLNKLSEIKINKTAQEMKA